MIFRFKAANGCWISESTTTNSHDRVAYRYTDPSYIGGYSFRRYLSVCCDPVKDVCPV